MSNHLDDDEPLPPGWRKVASNSRPGVPCYQHEHGRRMFKRPTATDPTTRQKTSKKPRPSTDTILGSSPASASVPSQPSSQPRTTVIEVVDLIQEEQPEVSQKLVDTSLSLNTTSKPSELAHLKPDVPKGDPLPDKLTTVALAKGANAPLSPRRNDSSQTVPVTPSPSKQGSRIVGSGSASRRKQVSSSTSTPNGVRRAVDPAEDAEFDFKPEPKSVSRGTTPGSAVPVSPMSDAGSSSGKQRATGDASAPVSIISSGKSATIPALSTGHLNKAVPSGNVELSVKLDSKSLNHHTSGGPAVSVSPLSDNGLASQKAKTTGATPSTRVPENASKLTAPGTNSSRPSTDASQAKTQSKVDADKGGLGLELVSSSSKSFGVQKEANPTLNPNPASEAGRRRSETNVPKVASSGLMPERNIGSGVRKSQPLDRQQSGSSRKGREHHSRDDGTNSRRLNDGPAATEPLARSSSGRGRESGDHDRRSRDSGRRVRSSSPRRRRERSKSSRRRDRSRSPRRSRRSRSPNRGSSSRSDKRQPSDSRSRTRPMPTPSASNSRVTSQAPSHQSSPIASPATDATSHPHSRSEPQQKKPGPIQTQSGSHAALSGVERQMSGHLQLQQPRRETLREGHQSDQRPFHKTVQQQPLLQPQSDSDKRPNRDEWVAFPSGEAASPKQMNGAPNVPLKGSAIPTVMREKQVTVSGDNATRETGSNNSLADNHKSSLVQRVRELCPIDRSPALVDFVQAKIRFSVEANGFILENGPGPFGSVEAVLSFLGLVSDDQALSRIEVPDKTALRSLRLPVHGRYPHKYISPPLTLLSSLKEAWVCRITDDRAAFFVETRNSKETIGSGANPKDALLCTMKHSRFSFCRSSETKRSYVFTRPEGCVIKLQEVSSAASKVVVQHVHFSWRTAPPNMNNPSPFPGDELLFVTFGDDEVWMPICKENIRQVIARQSEIKKLRYKSCCQSVAPLSEFIDLLERKNPLAEALDLPLGFFEHDADGSEIAHEMIGIGPGRLCALESVHKRRIGSERYSYQLIGMEETSKMIPKRIATAKANAEKKMEYILASGFFAPADPTVWKPLLLPSASLFPLERTPPVDINSGTVTVSSPKSVEAMEPPMKSTPSPVEVAAVDTSWVSPAVSVSGKSVALSPKASSAEIAPKATQEPALTGITNKTATVASNEEGRTETPLGTASTEPVVPPPSTSIDPSARLENGKAMKSEEVASNMGDEAIHRFLEEKVFRSDRTRHRFDLRSGPPGFISGLIEDTAICLPSEDDEANLVLGLMVEFLATQEEPTANEDLRPIFVPLPLTLSHILERLEKRFPDDNQGRRLACLHRFYTSLKPEADEDVVRRTEPWEDKTTVRYALRGLKNRFSFLNGLYQLTATAGIELYSFIGDEAGQLDQVEAATIASKYVLVHFPGLMWALSLMRGGSLLDYLCAADDRAERWALVTTSGVMEWDPEVKLVEVKVAPDGKVVGDQGCSS